MKFYTYKASERYDGMDENKPAKIIDIVSLEDLLDMCNEDNNSYIIELPHQTCDWIRENKGMTENYPLLIVYDDYVE